MPEDDTAGQAGNVVTITGEVEGQTDDGDNLAECGFCRGGF